MSTEDLDVVTPTDVMMKALGDASSAKVALVLWLREDGSMAFRVSDCDTFEMLGALEVVKMDLLTSISSKDGDEDDDEERV